MGGEDRAGMEVKGWGSQEEEEEEWGEKGEEGEKRAKGPQEGGGWRATGS